MMDNVKNFWNTFDLKKWAESIGGSSAEAIQAAIYFGLCFATGFLFKKYFKLVFVCLIVSLFVIKGLEYGKFLTIDWSAVKGFCGISQASDLNAVSNNCFAWIKAHLLLTGASVVGFLVGYKLG